MLALCALASTYLTYVVTRSSFPPVEKLRIAVFERWGDGSVPAYLATCTWCSGFWVSALVTFAAWLARDGLEVPVLYWLSSAAVVGVLLEVADTLAHAQVRLQQVDRE